MERPAPDELPPPRMMIYANRPHSYPDLPMRIGETDFR